MPKFTAFSLFCMSFRSALIWSRSAFSHKPVSFSSSVICSLKLFTVLSIVSADSSSCFASVSRACLTDSISSGVSSFTLSFSIASSSTSACFSSAASTGDCESLSACCKFAKSKPRYTLLISLILPVFFIRLYTLYLFAKMNNKSHYTHE